MRDRMNRALAAAAAAILLALLPASAGAKAPAEGPAWRPLPAAELANGAPSARDRAELRILKVVRSRTSDPKVLDRMQEKLADLSPAEVRLAASLCDRIAGAERTAGAELAFSLVAVLIALS